MTRCVGSATSGAACRRGIAVATKFLVGRMALCDLASPFHLHPEAPPVMVQGHPLPALPYAMGNRIFWTMVLPLVPIFLMVFGHEAWRRICPLSHFSQIPHMLGWQHKIKALNRRSGRVERVLALLPQGWLRATTIISSSVS